MTYAQNERNPAGATAEFQNTTSIGIKDSQDTAPKADVTQAKIELIREEIIATISPMIETLEAALAMAAIPNDAGMVFALRTARAYWRCASGNWPLFVMGAANEFALPIQSRHVAANR